MLKAMLPPGAYCHVSRIEGHWVTCLRPFPSCGKSWAVAGGDREAALFVLKDVWAKWLDFNNVPKNQCPIPGLFHRVALRLARRSEAF